LKDFSFENHLKTRAYFGFKYYIKYKLNTLKVAQLKGYTTKTFNFFSVLIKVEKEKKKCENVKCSTEFVIWF